MDPSQRPIRLRDLSREAIVARVRDGILAARDDVVGIVIFGSFARGPAWHDVDVLAVLRDRIPNRAAWREIAIRLTNSINLVELDLIPTWLEGLRLGLAAHRPLLMEVAFDGLIVHDRAGITDLLQAARLEIAQAGIRRTTTGWQFPVAYRQASPLSPESNDERARRWLFDAQRDLAIAVQLRETAYFDRSVYHCQQSIERSVKAVLICFGAFERLHYVGRRLLDQLREHNVDDWQERLERLAQISIAIEPAAIDARYIDDRGEEVYVPWEHYLEPDAFRAIEDARAALGTASEFIEWWFTRDR